MQADKKKIRKKSLIVNITRIEIDCINISTCHNWILQRHVTTYERCAKYILISLLNKSVDFKHLSFAGKSFHIHAEMLAA